MADNGIDKIQSRAVLFENKKNKNKMLEFDQNESCETENERKINGTIGTMYDS